MSAEQTFARRPDKYALASAMVGARRGDHTGCLTDPSIRRSLFPH